MLQLVKKRNILNFQYNRSWSISGIVSKDQKVSQNLDLAQRRAQTIAHSVADQLPVAWNNLISGETAVDSKPGQENQALQQAFQNEVEENLADDDFQAVESVMAKGRKTPLAIRRWQA